MASQRRLGKHRSCIQIVPPIIFVLKNNLRVSVIAQQIKDFTRSAMHGLVVQCERFEQSSIPIRTEHALAPVRTLFDTCFGSKRDLPVGGATKVRTWFETCFAGLAPRTGRVSRCCYAGFELCSRPASRDLLQGLASHIVNYIIHPSF